MHGTREQLARIGFATTREEPVCWRAARLELPVGMAGLAPFGPEPARSRALRRWRDRLRRDARRRPSPYLILRADGTG